MLAQSLGINVTSVGGLGLAHPTSVIDKSMVQIFIVPTHPSRYDVWDGEYTAFLAFQLEVEMVTLDQTKPGGHVA